MYNPETFLTKELLVKVLDNYKWKDNYVIRKEDCTIDGIKVRFPKCILFFREGFESDISLFIGNPLVKNIKYWSSFELINNVFKTKEEFRKLEYLDEFHPFASKEKVQLELHNLCIATKFYLQRCLSGDFKSVESYQKKN